MKRTLALVLAVAAAGIAATGGSAGSTERSGALHVTKDCGHTTSRPARSARSRPRTSTRSSAG